MPLRKIKEKPESWITKKEKPKGWITKKEKPTDISDIGKKLRNALAGGIKGKPHSSPEGQAASAGRTIKRLGQKNKRHWREDSPREIKVGNTQGGLLRDKHKFRDGGPEGKPHSTKEGRRAEAQRAYMRKHGPQEPRRKTLAVTDKYKEVREKLNPFAKKDISERFGGSKKGKPHSTKEGRVAAGRRRLNRILTDHSKPFPKRPKPRLKPWIEHPEYRPPKPKKRFMTPLRAKHGIGSLVKKIITKIKPKPKGVFKPKPVPKGVTDKPTGWSPKGSSIKSDDKKINSVLKNLGDEIKAAPLPPQLKKTLKKAQKAFPHKKAAGGRIGLQHGNRPRPQGPHTWVRKKPKGVKIAIKGW